MDTRYSVVVAVGIVAALAAAAVAVTLAPPADTTAIQTFEDADAFRSYLDRGATSEAYEVRAGFDSGPERVAQQAGDAASEPSARRHSRTNVQHRGIAEPDLFKTTGQTAYIAPSGGHRYDRPLDGLQPARPNTTVLDTRDPFAPDRLGSIDARGRLFEANGTVLSLAGDRLLAHDVTDPSTPDRRWTRSVNGSVETARRIGDRVLVVVAQPVDRAQPCPITPIEGAQVSCSEIARPNEPVRVDRTHTVLTLDIHDGSIADRTTVVGSGANAVAYVSEDALYLTDTREADRTGLYVDALLANAREDLSDETVDRLEALESYELSDRSRRIEARLAVQSHLDSVPADERAATRERIDDAVRSYVAERHRSLVETGIVRVEHTDGLQITARGTVPGRPVDQFAFDATDESLRVATTVPSIAGVNSTNDLYTLDRETLDRRGAVQGLSPGQSIFAARYVGDTAFLVTFRQVDPFHVIDLSDPDAPDERGQVELPGFSTYLHPVGEDRILGIGEEDGRVKATLFATSDPTDPQVADSITFDARWSAVRDSHHAVLQDRRHGVVVVPAGDTAHVLSYDDGLDEVATVNASDRVRRAGYVGDALYVVGTSELVVVDERDWSVTDRIELPGRVSGRIDPLPGGERVDVTRAAEPEA